ncbi:hypothetical protein U5640_25810 [Streptomyces sp. SS7]|uniref:hypothetical protein n=1 Tax=Streptomyces sp. SS7 TaxID=3108485 RepID=UPI0030EF6E19
MVEPYELRFFEDVLDWIKTLAADRQWAAWYPKAVREADDKYAAYLEALEQEKQEGQCR